MARRPTPSQLRSKLRQAEQKQRRAINDYNSAIRKFNRAVNDYNQKARAHNARVRSNQQRLRRELSRLQSSSRGSRYTVYRTSVVALRQSFERIESSEAAGTWLAGPELFDLAEGETANSVAVLNALLTQSEVSEEPEGDDSLSATVIAGELAEISPDLDKRWRGALFALSPRNPDAARHFCTSSREILTFILETSAPDEEVLSANPNADLTHDNRVTRRARIRHCLERRGSYDHALEVFVDQDVANVVELFKDFNQGAHGNAGQFDVPQLAAIKQRVEHAILFLHRIVT